MKRSILGILGFLAFAPGAWAQYYYKDIISNGQLTVTMQLYKENKVRNVDIKSFESDGSESEGFFCRKKISKDYRSVELFTRSAISSPSLFTSVFNTDGTLSYTNDSSDISVTKIFYHYDEQKRVRSIVSSVRSQDDDFVNEILEEHLYEYGTEKLPVKMFRIKNHTDTTLILFANDEHNNLGIEKDTRSGTKYYYYYDNQGRLTDVVQENDFKLRPMPDYIFEYDSNGNLSQMISTEEGANNYFTWKYKYENGLRTSEKCYSKDRRLMGSVQYEYK
ncbi:MAG: hypothetical protein WAT19_14245 [Ferruginibacter sp.]